MKKDPSSAPAAVAAAKALIGLAADRKAALPDRLWAVAQLHAPALPPSAPADERLRRASDRRTSTRFALMAIVDALPAAGIPDGHLEVFWDLIHLLEDLDTQIKTHDLLEIAGKRGPKKSERILRQRGVATAAVEILMSRASWTEESALRWVANRIKGWEAASEVKRRELWKAIQDWRGDARDGGDDMDRLLFRRALASCVRSPNIPAEKLAGMLTAAPPGQIRSFPSISEHLTGNVCPLAPHGATRNRTRQMDEPSRGGSAVPTLAGMAGVTPRRDPITYTVSDAVAVSGLSRATLYRIAAAGRLRLVKVGSRTLVCAASLRTLLGAGD